MVATGVLVLRLRPESRLSLDSRIKGAQSPSQVFNRSAPACRQRGQFYLSDVGKMSVTYRACLSHDSLEYTILLET
jgi:hypothetical protein